MVYSKIHGYLISILILIIILISNAILQEILVRRSIYDQESQHIIVPIPVNSPTCHYQSRYFQMQVPSCDTLIDHMAVIVTGRVAHDTDESIFHRKRLIVENIEPYSFQLYSLNDWKLYLQHVRQNSRQFIFKLLLERIPPYQAGLIIALVFGDTQWLFPSIQPYFETTGTLHILAASGQNIALVLLMVEPLIPPFVTNNIKGTVLVLVALLYVIVVGNQPSLMRALSMAYFSICSRYFLHRQYKAMYSLVISVFLLLLWRPEWIIAIGFWLSVCATSGIIILYSTFQEVIDAFLRKIRRIFPILNKFHSTTMSSYMVASSAAGMAAQLATLPIIFTQIGAAQLFSFIPTAVVSWIIPSMIFFTLLLILLACVAMVIPAIDKIVTVFALVAVYMPVDFFIFLLRVASYFKWGELTNPWYVLS